MDGSEQFEFCLKDNPVDMALAMKTAENACRRHQVKDEQIFIVNLCIEELLTNAVRYGSYGKDCLDIIIHLKFSDKGVALTVSDNAHPFNPLTEAPEPDLRSPLSERQIGGLGLHLLKKLTKSIAYEYKNACNTVSIAL